MAFDYSGARKEGYSDEEIANHLSSSSGFDLRGALENGYNYSEIVQHLSGTPVEAEVIDDPSARDSTIGEEFGRGANRMLTDVRASFGSLFGSSEDAALEAIERNREDAQRRGVSPSFAEMKEDYVEGGIPQAALGAVQDAPRIISQQLPNTLTTMGATAAGTVVGGPLGGLAAGYASLYPQLYSQNIQRQAEADMAAGRPVDIEEGKAMLAAVGQTAAEQAATYFTLGKGLVSRLLGRSPTQLSSRSSSALLNLAKDTAKGVARGAGIEIPTEVAQQIIERGQAGLEVMSDEAYAEYGEAAYMAGIAGGGIGGVSGAASPVFSQANIEEQPGVIPADDLSEITQETVAPDIQATELAPDTSEDAVSRLKNLGEAYDEDARRTQTLEKLDLIAPNLRGTLKGRGLDDIGLKLSYNLENLGGMARPEEVDALYDPDVKTIFLGADRIKGFADMDAPQLQREFGGLVDHEMVHAVKRMNLWKDSEWRVLENAARKNFNSEGTSYLQTAQERYSTDTAEIQSEEAIAELIRDTLAGRTKLSGQPLNLMQRLLEFFRKMGNSLTGTGYASFNQVVNDIDTGVLGARPRGGRQATPVGTSIIGGSPALASRRVNSNIQGQQVMNLEGMTGEQVAAEELRLAEQTTRQEQAAVGVAETRRILDSTEEPLASRGRLDRAKEQGFDTSKVLYHYTNKLEDGSEFNQFIPSTRGKIGAGVYLSPSPNYSETYVRDRNLDSEDQSLKGFSENSRAIPVYVKGNIANREEYGRALEEAKAELDSQTDYDVVKQTAQNKLKEQGYSGINFVRPRRGGSKFNDNELVIFDPKNIRSVNAEFAASAVGSSNLLASRGLLGLSEEDVIETPLRARGPNERNAELHVGYIEDFVRKYVPKSKAERESLARAKEQGFNTDKVWYHGTPYNFSEFKPIAEGESTTLGGFYNDLGFFFTDERTYSAPMGSDSENNLTNVIPVYSRLQNPFITNDIERIEYWLQENNKEFKKKFPEDAEFEQAELEFAIREALQDMGYDGIIQEEGNSEGYGTWLIAFNPSDIRSVKATYDSSAVGSSNLLASRGAVSTRFPTAKRRIVNPIEELIVNQYQDYLDGPTFAKNMGVINSYDELLGSGTDIEQAQKFVEHVKNNLLFVYDSIDPQIRERSAKWYEGANKLMQKLADKHGLTLEQTAAVAANLSPQKDWYMNASLAERVVDIYQESINESFTPEMEAKGVELFTAPLKGKDRTPTKIKNRKQNIERLETIKGKSLADLVAEEAPLLDQAMWIRIYDQTYNSPSYQVLSPEGEYVGAALNQDGAKSKSGWGSLNEIAKGLIALQDGSLSSISPSLGDANKVRNFYNNIYDPYAEEGFVTIDTHAVAAGLLRPLGGSAPQVSANFGTLKGVGNSSVTGHKGVYSLYEEAYRRAAEEKNILPREMQSITWEGIRGLFSADYKQVETNQEFANNIWKQYSNGSITLDKVREEILRHADQFSDPEWARPNYGNVEVERTSGYERKLSDAGVSRLGGEGVGSRGRVDATGRASAKKLKTKPEDSSALAADKSKALTENNEDLESDQAASEQLIAVKKLASRNNPSDIVEGTAYNRVADISSKRAARGQGDINNALPFEAPSSADDKGFVYQIQDKFIDLKKAVENIRKNRLKRGLTPLASVDDPYLGEESMHGIIGNKFNNFQKDVLEPLVNKLKARNISLKELEEFLVLRHAIERNTHVRKINAESKQPRPELQDGGAGSLNGQRLLDNYVKNEMQSKYGMQWNDSTQSWEGGNPRASVLNDLAADFDSITRGTLQELKDSGLMDQKSLDKLQSYYKYYAPLRGRSPEEDVAIEEHARFSKSSNNLSIKGVETEATKGRVSEAMPPLAQIVTQRQTAIRRGSINELVGQRMLSLIRENPNDSYWKIHNSRDSAGANAELFGVKEDGKQLFVEFKDRRLRDAMLSLDAPQTNKALAVMRKINRFFSAVNTSYNPAFVFGNFFRDLGTAIGNLVGEQTMVGGKALNAKGLKRAVFSDTPASIRQVYRGLRGKKLAGKSEQDWKDYLESGAKTEWFHVQTPEESAASIDELIEMSQGTFKGNYASGKKAIGNIVSDLNSAVENGVRFATFKKGRDEFVRMGLPREEALAKAATLAKNLTVNFNRMGNQGELLNAFYLFFNASVQGTANFVRGITTSRSKQAMLLSMVSFGAFVTRINELMGEDDEELGKSYYSQIEPWVKERNFILMKSIFDSDAPPNEYYTVPLPYGYNVLHVLGMNIMDVAMGKKSPEAATTQLASTSLSSFMPVGFGESENPAIFVTKGITPQIGKPIVEMLANEDFFGSPVYTENLQFGPKIPAALRSQRSTPAAFTETTKFLNAISDGDESHAGKLGWISPDVLDHLFGTILGGLGSFVERSAQSSVSLTDWVEGDYVEGDISINDIPFLRRAMREVTGRESQSNYYDRRDDIMADDRQMRLLRGAERGEYRNENRSRLLMKRMLDSTDKRLRNINKRLAVIGERILTSTSLEQTLRLEEMQQRLEDQKESAYKRFNKRFNEKVGETK